MEEILTEEAKLLEQKLVISRPPILRQPYPYPHPYIWLLICNGKNNERQTFYNILKDRYYMRSIPEMQNKDVCYSFQDWLVLKDYDSSDCYLLNIFTMEKIQLPPLDISRRFHCVLSLPRKDGDRWRVLFFEGYAYKTTSCYVGDTEFVGEEYVFPDCGIMLSAINFEGKVCAITMYYHLYIADPSNHDLGFTKAIEGESLKELLLLSSTNDTRYYLVESSGELLFILMKCYGVKVVDVKILRADFKCREWVRFDRLGDRAIFLDEFNAYYSSHASINGLIKSNSIYFVNGGSRNLYVYDIEDQSISILVPCPIVRGNSPMNWIRVPN